MDFVSVENKTLTMKTPSENPWLYRFLARLPVKSYKGKIIFVALLGTQIPLLVILIALMIGLDLSPKATFLILFLALVGTILANFVIFYTLNNLLKPVAVTSKKLKAYFKNQEVPNSANSADTMIALRQIDDTMERMTYYDSVTSLPNRALLQVHLQKSCQHSQREIQRMGILFIGLDNFQEIRNTFSLGNGQFLLQHCAQELLDVSGANDEAFHFGEGNFALLLRDLSSAERPVFVAKQLLEELSFPFSTDMNNMRLTVSIGITLYPDDGVQAERLLKNADIALMQARQQGGNTYQFHSPEFNAKLRDRVKLESELYHALERKQLLLYYQPKIDLNSDKIIGVEALLRWQHPELGFVSPGKFIPIAEESDLILDIGSWVLKEACQQNYLWQKEGLEPVSVAVNLSARQFHQKNLLDIVQKALKESGLEGNWLELEITETLLMDNIEESLKMLEQFINMNVSIGLDDFGTGYSSFSYLRKLPITNLKIDRSFVKECTTWSQNGAIIEAIIALAHKLDLLATVEGIETQEQLNFMKDCGCDVGQGFYWGRPVSGDQMTAFLYQPYLTPNG